MSRPIPSNSADRSDAATRALVGVDAIGDPALLVGGDLRVISANAAARGLFGERIVADDLRLVLRHPAVLDAVRAAPSAAAPIEREVTGLGNNNGAFRVRVAQAGVDGPGVRLFLTFVDITQARLTERMRVDFIANASHELRTPVTTLLGFIETLQGPAAEDEPARRRFLDIMGREAARMSRLIDDLLSLSRIELDKHLRPQTALDVAPLIADVGRTLAMRLEADQRRLVIHVADGLPAVIADRDQVLQVLHNLVSNALKYGRTGTAITVDAQRVDAGGGREAMVRVTVGDRGEGIAPEHLPRLTERFYRIDTSRSRSMGGTGLGLAIVKHIIERHRGGFEIVSRPGEGSEVSFTLPLASTELTITKVGVTKV
ncbi:ATP-binding protein [Glacieibacterium megasporae]|uniref:ATP-binding protein n=1 Tax=Glacieibacterium megasporae TaxID=2835787 RepID=UPI001C1DD1DB|nr:ATP-binding protein [Polymorphobacter megasporae]UAJ09531.1 ATPase [Polymorphobacter megasporae]